MALRPQRLPQAQATPAPPPISEQEITRILLEAREIIDLYAGIKVARYGEGSDEYPRQVQQRIDAYCTQMGWPTRLTQQADATKAVR